MRQLGYVTLSLCFDFEILPQRFVNFFERICTFRPISKMSSANSGYSSREGSPAPKGKKCCVKDVLACSLFFRASLFVAIVSAIVVIGQNMPDAEQWCVHFHDHGPIYEKSIEILFLIILIVSTLCAIASFAYQRFYCQKHKAD